jgi:hypothetical protein
LDKSEKLEREKLTKVKQPEKSCPPKSIKQIEKCLQEISDCAKATKAKSSSTEQ